MLYRLHATTFFLNVFLCSHSFSETPHSQGKVLPPLITVLKDASFSTVIWELAIEFKKDSNSISHEQYATALNTFGKYEPNGEHEYAQKYRDEMKDAFSQFSYYCENAGLFLSNSQNRPIPFRFAEKNGKKAVLLVDMASQSIYNTLRNSSTGRASKVLQSCLIPKIKSLCEAFKKTDMAYFGLSITYGSKDFSNDEEVLNLKPEVLTFVASREMCKRFSDGSITESEFVDGSDTYLTDRDMIFDFKKIKPNME